MIPVMSSRFSSFEGLDGRSSIVVHVVLGEPGNVPLQADALEQLLHAANALSSGVPPTVKDEKFWRDWC